MNQNEMIQSLRAEIAKLQRVLDALLDEPSTPEPFRRPGRPSGSTNGATSFNPDEFAPKKRTMSAEGKARIAAAQKKRWAAQNGATAKKSASTKRTSKAVSPQSAGKVAPATAKKSTGARKRPGSTQVGSTKASGATASAKSATKKTADKKTIKRASKRPAKQVAAAGPESSATV